MKQQQYICSKLKRCRIMDAFASPDYTGLNQKDLYHIQSMQSLLNEGKYTVAELADQGLKGKSPDLVARVLRANADKFPPPNANPDRKTHDGLIYSMASAVPHKVSRENILLFARAQGLEAQAQYELDMHYKHWNEEDNQELIRQATYNPRTGQYEPGTGGLPPEREPHWYGARGSSRAPAPSNGGFVSSFFDNLDAPKKKEQDIISVDYMDELLRDGLGDEPWDLDDDDLVALHMQWAQEASQKQR